MRRRTRAREIALQFLYRLDLCGNSVQDEMEPFIRSESEDEEILSYTRSLVAGVGEHRKELDDLIQKAATNWDLKRIAVVDRNILRVACYEMQFTDDVPATVAINEAITIAKKFSSAKAGQFANGILDRIRRQQESSAPKP